MAFGVAQAAGGTQTIDSEEGRGTTVSILLPMTDQDAVAIDDVARTAAPATRTSRTILLVVDDDAVCSTIADLLTVAGHRVTAVGDGQAALAALGGTRFDLLLLDYAMPGMNGAQVAEGLWRNMPTSQSFSSVAIWTVRRSTRCSTAARGSSPNRSILATCSTPSPRRPPSASRIR